MDMTYLEAWFMRSEECTLSVIELLRSLRATSKLSWSLHRRDLIDEELDDICKTAKERVSARANEFSRARGKVNPFECLGKGPRGSAFINRSALKMANMDHCFEIFGDKCLTYLDVCGKSCVFQRGDF